MRAVLPLVLLSLAACADGGTDESPFADCGDQAPTFDAVTVEALDGTYQINGEERQVVQVSAVVDDADGGLHTYVAEVWYETFLEDDFEETPQYRVAGDAASESPCGVNQATVGALLPLGGSDVPFGTQVKFGLVIEDADGNVSNGGVPVEVVATTPDETAE